MLECQRIFLDATRIWMESVTNRILDICQALVECNNPKA